MENPFKRWSADDVAQHNQRVRRGRSKQLDLPSLKPPSRYETLELTSAEFRELNEQVARDKIRVVGWTPPWASPSRKWIVTIEKLEAEA